MIEIHNAIKDGLIPLTSMRSNCPFPDSSKPQSPIKPDVPFPCYHAYPRHGKAFIP